MIRCIAIDDEPLALQQISKYIEETGFLSLVAACGSTAEAKKILDKEHVDIMFLDINMPDQSGLDFVRSLQAPPVIVFTTAYPDYALEGYKVDAVDYLLKPFSLDEFTRAADKAKRALASRWPEGSVSAVNDDVIFFKTDYKVVRVDINDINYVEGMSEYLKIRLDEGDPVVVLLSVKKLEERLPSDRFMRIHKSYIVNLNKIKEVSRMRVVMKDGSALPIGNLYKDHFMAYLDSKFLGK